MKFTGIMPALITPLNKDETINTAVLERLIDDFISRGADGFYLAGATGEGLALRPSERMKLAECAVARCKGKVKTIVQVASTDFNTAVELARHAEKCGADAISSTAPLFFGFNADEVYSYYKALAEAVHIPLMIYYNPGAGFAMNAQFVARCFEVDNITSVKWTSYSYDEMMRLKDLTKGKINVINGPDETLLLGLTAGADGGIGTTYNFNYNAIRNIYNLFKEGKMEEARREQENVCRIISMFHKGYRTIPATRALLEYMGYDVGDATFPFVKYSKEKKEEIVKVALEAGWKPW
jgi:N-acetylneuraminate lyase